MKLKDEKKIEALFPDLVGQTAPKKKIAFFIENARQTGIFPNTLIVAPRGSGKTLLARCTAQNLKKREEDKPKPFVELNCSTIKNLKQFVNQVILMHLHEKEATILFDEASELPKDLTMALLTMLAPNKSNKNFFTFDDFTFEIDFRRHTFLFATTEAQDVFHALKDRLERIELEEYSSPELGEIMMKRLPDIKVAPELCLDVASVLRGNARAADVMGGHIASYCKSRKKDEFTRRDWDSLRDYLSILPLGVSEIELRVLMLLYNRVKDVRANSRGYSLLHLSSITDMTTQSLQRDVERYLLKLGLIEKETSGRVISAKGMDYIRGLKKLRGEDYKQ
jgi:Holliday junction resolvasome RuvABC ATP-dependent DNA helicase subunit